jgi:hypothetical protein
MRTIALAISLFILLPALPAGAAIFSHRIDEDGRHEIFAELDPYYSSLDYVFSLTDDPIPAIQFESEPGIYWYLLKNIYRPRYLLFEASVNPLPIAGTEIRRHYYDYYATSQITPHFNLIKAITAGFPEPYAFSFFWGNVADFVKDDVHNVVGKGYSGLLMSYGPKHIINNIIVDDNWFEMEIKLKGSDEREAHNISWSYAWAPRFIPTRILRTPYIYPLSAAGLITANTTPFR